MRVASFGWRVAAVAALLGGNTPGSAGAQASPTGAVEPSDGTVVGLLTGVASTTQVWRPDTPSESLRGLAFGVFADAVTPVPNVSIRGEGGWVRRGGDVELEVGGEPATGGIRTDYLRVAVLGTITRRVGPVRVHVAAGPSVEQVLSSSLDAILGQILDEEKSVVFGVAAQTGVGVWVTSSLFVGVEARFVENLADAYGGAFTTVRNRSTEATLRIGVPISAIRGR